MAKLMGQLVLGDPLEMSTQLPPLAKADLVDEIDRQVKATISE